MTDAAPELAVVIVAYNAARTVEACLSSLRRQRTGRRFEVILVDSSTDGTGDLVAASFPEVRLLRFTDRKYCGDGRNIGVSAASAPLVAFLDSDCVAADDWVEQICSAQEGPWLAIGGAIANHEPSSLTGWAVFFCEFSRWMPGTPAQWMSDMAGANMSYKTEVFHALGPFIEATYCSDTEFHWRLAEAGHAIRFHPSIRVSHTYLAPPLAFLRHEFMHGRSFARVRVVARAFPAWRRYAYAAGFAVIAVTILLRIIRRVVASRSYLGPFLVASPLLVAGVLSWSIGECAGYLDRASVDRGRSPRPQ